MALTFKGTIAIIIVAIAAVCVSASVSGKVLEVPLFEVGGLWLNAVRTLVQRLAMFVSDSTDLTSPWTYVKVALTCFTLYALHFVFCKPLNRIRDAEDVGYIPEGRLSKRDVVNAVRRRRATGDVPPVYPNGWFAVIESHFIKRKEVENIYMLGLTLAVFRDENDEVHAIDAYCPHLGANLAVGGQVKGDCLECPFHGWQFRGSDGKCTHIPYSEKVPEFAKVKSWPVHEMNGWIYLWYHAEKVEPYWMPPEIDEITDGSWTYRGRTEHIINAHIEEIPENGADLAHLPQVHSPFLSAGVDLRYTYSKIWGFAKHEWAGNWTADEEHKHIGSLKLVHTARLFGIRLPFLDVHVTARQVGPSLVFLAFEGLFGKGVIFHFVTPIEPLVQKLVHNIYIEWKSPTIFAKFMMWGEATQIERDIMIWNNKMYKKQPIMVKSKEDALLMKHRRWYSQFYSENSPRLTFQKEGLEW